MLTSRRVGSWILSFSLAGAAALTPTAARAEADVFALGTAKDGAFTATAQNQVVNLYAPMSADAAAGATQVAIGTAVGASAFANGDLVLLWRAKGVDAGAVPSSVMPDVPPKVRLADLEGGAVGVWELARISAVAGGTLTLTQPLVRPWKADLTQVIRVPEYTTVTVPNGTSLSPRAWQASGTGFVGGIVAFLATGAVTLQGNGSIDADGRGFRGGPSLSRVGSPLDCPNADGTLENGYAPKGEGIVTLPHGAANGGRGKRSIAAGGGNCIENGGGGGGNFGQGGNGGSSVVNTARGGVGGAALDYALLDRFTMGGGGGSGDQNDDRGSGGGAGGGVVFFRARSLGGTGRITANGQAAQNASVLLVASDGAGGGGAGGSVLVRLVDNAVCGGIDVKGGKGGDTQVVNVTSFFGPGGGGAGGRALLQAASTAGCTVDAAAGAAGLAGGQPRGAASGEAGQNELPVPQTAYCFSNPAANPQCANPTPVCETTRGFCRKCSGPFGGGPPFACTTEAEPVCLATGACVVCNGDLGANVTAACQLSASPYCSIGGTCGKCTNNTDCTTGTHQGPICNVALGACGIACTMDSQCAPGEWCAQNVCVPKTPNSQPLASVPPINGECTPANGTRTCRSGFCEANDDLCGLANGSLCAGDDARCRSAICFDADNVCGKPTGEPCAIATECRSAECKDGVCTGCDDDVDCARDKICNKATNQCVSGCRPSAQRSNAGTARGFCPPEHDCIPVDGGDIGVCTPRRTTPANDGGTGDGGFFFEPGSIEGAGCNCETTALAGGATPFACIFGAFSAMMLLYRRSTRKKERR